MSTEYTTEPKIEFDAILTCPLFSYVESEQRRYTVRHKIIFNDKFPKGIWLFEWEGVARFERVGTQDSGILEFVENYFNVKVYDEYGLELELK